jgi:hypothetical protein
VRRTLKSAPLHGFSAPVAGSGKSLLVDLAGIVATGSQVPVTAQANEEELEKRLASFLFAGDAIISIDNCTKPLGGDLLCQMLTQETVKPRVLGESKNPNPIGRGFHYFDRAKPQDRRRHDPAVLSSASLTRRWSGQNCAPDLQWQT